MNALFGVPDVQKMNHDGIDLVAVLAHPLSCGFEGTTCFFHPHPDATCIKYCMANTQANPRIWIRPEQLPEYLAARLLEGAP